MIEVFEWMRGNPQGSRDWLILGKGPAFSRHSEFPDLDARYATVGLNHVCRERPVFAAHCIDAEVTNQVGPMMVEKAKWLVMPWRPHVKFGPTEETLEEMARSNPVIARFEAEGRLVWYNASTSGNPRPGSPKVCVLWFSAEAVVRWLAMGGTKTIRTLGIDGGSAYADQFKDMKPFIGGHTSFDIQQGPINETVAEFGLDYGPLVK